MSTKTYRAATMREALAQVRRDLGGDAVILGTREVRRRRLFGLGRRELVEVVASSAGASGEGSGASVRKETAFFHTLTPDSLPLAPTEAPQGLGDELRRLHQLVEDLSRQGRIDHLLPELPGELVPTYATLVEADVPEALARRLVRHVAERLEP